MKPKGEHQPDRFDGGTGTALESMDSGTLARSRGMTKKNEVDDKNKKNADGEETQVEEKNKEPSTPPEEPEEEKEEDAFDSETRRPRMRW
jgi:hypothetical protein